jgi:hypothetical protein
VGGGGFALAGYMASASHGFPSALWYSLVGLVGAPLSTLSWSSRRSEHRSAMAGVALALGILTSMALLLDVTSDTSEIVFAWTRVPLALAAWLVLWVSWQALALLRLILFEPPRVRSSSRRSRTNR